MKPIVILDLEWNGTYSKRLKGFINEIIEFGAVKTDSHLQPADTFSLFVRPQVGKKSVEKLQHLPALQMRSWNMAGSLCRLSAASENGPEIVS